MAWHAVAKLTTRQSEHSPHRPWLAAVGSIIAVFPLPAQDALRDVEPDLKQLEAVVVTAAADNAWMPSTSHATRSDAPLIEIPQSIQVIPRQLLDEQDTQNIADALVNVSAVLPTRSHETLILSPLVRGFPAEIYIDGQPSYGTTAAVDPSSLVNVDSIEVIKGPTAALFGGGVGSPLGGIIHLNTLQPTNTSTRTMGLRMGGENSFSPFADFNMVAHDDDALALRVTGDFESADSYINAVHQRRWSLNPTIRWQSNSRTRLTLQGQFSQIQQLEYSGLPAALVVPRATTFVENYTGPVIDPYRFTGALDAPDSVIKNARLVAVLDHEMSVDSHLRISAQHYQNHFDEFATYTFSSAQSPLNSQPSIYPVLTGYLPSNVAQTTLNGTLTRDFRHGAMRHKLMLGMDFDHTENNSALGYSNLRIPLPAPFPDTVLPVRAGLIDFSKANSTIAYQQPDLLDHSRNHFTTLGFFVQDHLTAWQRLHFLGGVRLVNLNIDHQFRTDNSIGSETQYEQNYLESAPRLGAVLDIGGGVSAFSATSNGLRGVLNYTGKEPPQPERSIMTEGGFKWDNPDHHLQGCIAAYQLVRENVPTANPFVPGSTLQVGEQEAHGIDLDLCWQPHPSFSLLSTYANTNATVTRDIINKVPTQGQNIDRIGKHLARVPQHSGRVAARYRFLQGTLEGFGIGCGITAASKRPVSLTNNYYTEPYYVADAQISYETESWQFELSIQNLTNQFYYEPYPYLGEDVVAPTRPLACFLSITTQF